MRDNMHHSKKEGVTLVALVITIVVLLLLVSIAISMSLGNDGLIAKTVQGKNNAQKAENLATLQDKIIAIAIKGQTGTLSQREIYDQLMDQLDDPQNAKQLQEYQKEHGLSTIEEAKKKMLEDVGIDKDTWEQQLREEKLEPLIDPNRQKPTIPTDEPDRNDINKVVPLPIKDDERLPMIIRVLPDTSNRVNIQVHLKQQLQNCRIEWGDGQVTTNIVAANTHTYPNRQERTIKIYGNFKEAGIFGDSKTKWNGSYWGGPYQIDDPNFLNKQTFLELRGIESWGENNFGDILFTEGPNIPYTEPLPRSFESLKQYSIYQMQLSNTIFANAPKLDNMIFPYHSLKFGTIPPEVFRHSQNLRHTFLTFMGYSGTIPPDIFAYCKELRSSYATFMRSSITGTIPPNLFINNSKLAYVDSVFLKCYGLTGTIPPNLFTNKPHLYALIRVFADCTGLRGTAPEYWREVKDWQKNQWGWKALYYNCRGLSNFNNLPATAKEEPWKGYS